MFLGQLFEAAGKQVKVIYPGRFQPFHKGHAQVYRHLCEKFGKDNVYIVTSDKVEMPKSPFSFAEKKAMIGLTGIDTSRVIQDTQPYRAQSLVAQFDAANTILLFAVSEKDMAEDPRFQFKPKKDGSPSYFQAFKDLKQCQTLDKHGYMMTVPTFNFTVLGKPANSASQIRAQFAGADLATQRKIVTDLFGKFDNNVFNIMKARLEVGEPVTETAPKMNGTPEFHHRAANRLHTELSVNGQDDRLEDRLEHHMREYKKLTGKDVNFAKTAKRWGVRNHFEVSKPVTEGANSAPDTSMILYYLTDAYKKISTSDAYSPTGKQTIKMIYDSFRNALRNDDFAAFEEEYSHYSAKYPDAFDDLMDEAFSNAGLDAHSGTYEKFISKVTEGNEDVDVTAAIEHFKKARHYEEIGEYELADRHFAKSDRIMGKFNWHPEKEISKPHVTESFDLDRIEERFGTIYPTTRIVEGKSVNVYNANFALFSYLTEASKVGLEIFYEILACKMHKIHNIPLIESVKHDRSTNEVFRMFNSFKTGNNVSIGDKVSLLELSVWHLGGNTIKKIHIDGFMNLKEVVDVSSSHIKFEDGSIWPDRDDIVHESKYSKQVIIFKDQQEAEKCLTSISLYGKKIGEWEITNDLAEDESDDIAGNIASHTGRSHEEAQRIMRAARARALKLHQGNEKSPGFDARYKVNAAQLAMSPKGKEAFIAGESVEKVDEMDAQLYTTPKTKGVAAARTGKAQKNPYAEGTDSFSQWQKAYDQERLRKADPNERVSFHADSFAEDRATSKPPKKGSQRWLTAQKRKEYEKNHPPVEPADQMYGTAKILPKKTEEGRLPQLPTTGADYSKFDTEHLKSMLRPGVMHRNELKFKTLIRRELRRREKEQVTELHADTHASHIEKRSPQIYPTLMKDVKKGAKMARAVSKSMAKVKAFNKKSDEPNVFTEETNSAEMARRGAKLKSLGDQLKKDPSNERIRAMIDAEKLEIRKLKGEMELRARDKVAENNNYNPQDTVTFDIPLLIRMLEFAREDAKTDMDLHNVTEKLIAMSADGKTLSMAQYNSIVSPKLQESINRQLDEVITKVKGGYEVKSHKGKNLGGPYTSKKQAAKRLGQVEYFKHKGKTESIVPGFGEMRPEQVKKEVEGLTAEMLKYARDGNMRAVAEYIKKLQPFVDTARKGEVTESIDKALRTAKRNAI